MIGNKSLAFQKGSVHAQGNRRASAKHGLLFLDDPNAKGTGSGSKCTSTWLVHYTGNGH